MEQQDRERKFHKANEQVTDHQPASTGNADHVTSVDSEEDAPHKRTKPSK